MEKVYGYKEKDLIEFANYLSKSKKGILTEKFAEFAKISGKAKGTVRNLYYALAKLSEKDKAFTEKYLKGVPIAVNKTETFKECEERALLFKVLTATENGRSARSVITEMACGDPKLALRLQNKYRSLLSGNSQVKTDVIRTLKEKYPDFKIKEDRPKPQVSEFQIRRLENEINGLIDRLTGNLKKENEFYKRQIAVLKSENEKLALSLFGENKRRALDFFTAKTDRFNASDR